MPGGESRPLGRLHVDRVVVEEEHPVAGDREPGRHGVEDGGVRLDQAELEGEEAKGEGLGQRDPLVVGRPLERVHVGEEGRRDRRLHLVDQLERPLEGGSGQRPNSSRNAAGSSSSSQSATMPAANSSGVHCPASKRRTHRQLSQRVHSASSLSMPLNARMDATPPGRMSTPPRSNRTRSIRSPVTAAMLEAVRTRVEYTLFCGRMGENGGADARSRPRKGKTA